MYKSQKGFTLIELVVVIVLLGILGVTALGKFQDLSGAARAAAVDGIASEISAAAAINFAAGAVTAGGEDVEIGPAGTANIIAAGGAPCTTANLQQLLGSGIFPTGYTIAAGLPAAPNCNAANLGVGGTFSCTITDSVDATATATATLICTADS